MGTTMASESKCAKQDFSQILFEQLKCHICESRLTIGRSRWYRCTQGHMICQDCKEDKGGRTDCYRGGYAYSYGSCAKPIQSGHCKLIEALLNADKLQFKCENLTRGCQESTDEE